MGTSGAQVKLYLSQSGRPDYTFDVPNGGGTLWAVFTLVLHEDGLYTVTRNEALSYHKDPGTIVYSPGQSADISDSVAFDLEIVEKTLLEEK
jgi:hypothetical protein